MTYDTFTVWNVETGESYVYPSLVQGDTCFIVEHNIDELNDACNNGTDDSRWLPYHVFPATFGEWVLELDECCPLRGYSCEGCEHCERRRSVKVNIEIDGIQKWRGIHYDSKSLFVNYEDAVTSCNLNNTMMIMKLSDIIDTAQSRRKALSESILP